MGELTDKAKGAVNDTIGNAKQAIGNATDDQALAAEGVDQEAKGKGQKIVGSVKGALGDDI